jgi:hypothetical protein
MADGEVLWHVTMSLDGFITGPDDAMEWAFEYETASPLADEVMNTTGAILAGRRWYDIATSRSAGREGIYGGAWRCGVRPDPPTSEYLRRSRDQLPLGGHRGRGRHCSRGCGRQEPRDLRRQYRPAVPRGRSSRRDRRPLGACAPRRRRPVLRRSFRRPGKPDASHPHRVRAVDRSAISATEAIPMSKGTHLTGEEMKRRPGRG